MQRRSLSRRTFLSLAAGTAAARPLMAATNSWGLLDQPLANGAAGFQGPDWQNQGVLNLAHSPYAKLRECSGAGGDDRGRILGEAADDECRVEHPVDA